MFGKLFQTRKGIDGLVKSGDLILQDLPYLKNIATTGIKIYKADSSNVVPIIQKDYNYGTIKINTNSVFIMDNETFIVVLLKWEGLYDLISFLQEKFKNKKNVLRDLEFAKYDISASLATFKINISEINQKYAFSITNQTIEIFNDIIPQKYCLQNQLYDIPPINRSYITKIRFHMNIDCLLMSVQINGFHPNAKDGWFCIGKLKSQKICLSTIDNVMERLNIYNLDDCYVVPTWFKK